MSGAYELPGDDSHAEPAPKKRRNRKPVTCANCRKRKLKCDRNAPCGACRERGEAHLCSWEDAIRPPQQQTSSRDIEAIELRNQLDRLESILGLAKTEAGPLKPGEELSLPAGFSLGGSKDGFEGPASAILASFGSLTSPHLMLPDRMRLDSCIHHFLSYQFHTVPVGHLPTLWNRFTKPPTSGQNSVEDWHLAALLLAVCAVASASMSLSTNSSAAHHPTIQDARSYADKAVNALVSGRYMEHPTFDALATLLLVHELYMSQSPPAARAYLAIAVQLGSNLGLNRESLIQHRYSRLQGEVGRRLWTLITNYDILHTHGRAYSCNSLHWDTAAPEYVEDNDIAEPNQRWNTRARFDLLPISRMTMNRDLATIARSITDRAFSIHDPPSYRSVLDMNVELTQVEASIPPCLVLRWQGSQIIMDKSNGLHDLQRGLAQCDLRREYIRLHRPFLRLGFNNSAYAGSRGACLNNARTILAIQRSLSTEARASESWQLIFFAVNAALVVAFDLFQDRNGPYAAGLQAELDASCELLAHPATLHPGAAEALKVLKTLSRAELPNVLGKRIRDDGLISTAGAYGSSIPTVQAFAPAHENGMSALGGAADIESPFMRPLSLPVTIEDEAPTTIDTSASTDLRRLLDGLLPWSTLFWAAPSRDEWLELCG